MMNITKYWKRTLIGGAAALTLAAGLLMTTGVETTYAQDAPDTPDTSAWEGHRGGSGHAGIRGGHFGGERGDDGQARMAEALGISVEELEAARAEAHDAAIQEALANGDITQEQVDLMEAHRAVRDLVDPHAVMAELLGVSVEELAAVRADGTLRDLLSELELDRTELAEKLQIAKDEALSQAVADGVITQEQADHLQEQGAERGFGHNGFGKRGFDGNSFGQPDGEGRGNRAPRGFFNQNDG